MPLCQPAHPQGFVQTPLLAQALQQTPAGAAACGGRNSQWKGLYSQPPWLLVGIMAHLEVILMPEWDLRAGASRWLSSARTDWSTLSFTTYWLLLEGCHSTPKILEKEKKPGEKKKMQPFPPFTSPQEISLFPLAEEELSSSQSHLLHLQNVGKEKPEEPGCGTRQHQLRTSKRILSAG